MADFMSDMNNLVGAMGNLANNITRLHQVRADLESARVQSDLQKLNNNFLMRTKMKPGDRGRVDITNWRDELERHQAEQDRVLESVKWDSVKGKVRQEMDPLAGKFNLAFADALNAQEVEKAQADFLTLTQDAASNGDLESLNKYEKQQEDERIIGPLDWANKRMSLRTTAESNYLTRKINGIDPNDATPERTLYKSEYNAIVGDSEAGVEAKSRSLETLREKKVKKENQFDEDVNTFLSPDAKTGQTVDIGAVEGLINSAITEGYVDKNKIAAAKGKVQAYKNERSKGQLDMFLSRLTTEIASREDYTKGMESAAMRAIETWEKSVSEVKDQNDPNYYWTTNEGKEKIAQAKEDIRNYEKRPAEAGPTEDDLKYADQQVLNMLDQANFVANGVEIDDVPGLLLSLARGGSVIIGGKSVRLNTSTKLGEAQKMAKEMYEKILELTPEAADQMTSDKGLMTFMYQMITDTRAGDFELKSAIKKSLEGGKLSVGQQVLINKFNLDAAYAYKRISQGRNLTPQELSKEVFPALLAITSTYGEVFAKPAMGFGKTVSQQAADLWSKIETLDPKSEIVGRDSANQVVDPRGGTARLKQIDSEVMALTKQFAGLGEQDVVSIQTDDNKKTVTVKGELYQLKTVEVNGKKEFILKQPDVEAKDNRGNKTTVKGKEIKLYKEKRPLSSADQKAIEQAIQDAYNTRH